MAGIYIHIPFCKHKCAYCDFYSVVPAGYGKGAGASRSVAGKLTTDSYVSAIVEEAIMRKRELGDEQVKTLYIGGGTPSVLEPEQIANVIKVLKEVYSIKYLKEFTIEVNPDDVSEEYIRSLVELGVNRISMGVQSFVDKELVAVGRRHTATQAIAAVESVRRAGIGNVSIDLIYGLPGQTLESWRNSLEIAVSLEVEHLSCYSLSYEPGTRLYYMLSKGLVKECDEDICINMFKVLLEVVKSNGYEQYEVSNFARDGHYSMHNSNYWNGTSYLGLGAAAHSYDGRVRRFNVANIKSYMKCVAEGRVAYDSEELTESERYDEYVMTRMRTMLGVNINDLGREFGDVLRDHFVQEAAKYVSSGSVVESGGYYRLTESGVMISDMIIRDLMG